MKSYRFLTLFMASMLFLYGCTGCCVTPTASKPSDYAGQSESSSSADTTSTTTTTITTTEKATTTATIRITTTKKPTTTTTVEVLEEQDQTEMVWIPQSGSKYHSRSSCSGMKNPTKVSLEEAKSMGYTACKRCH